MGSVVKSVNRAYDRLETRPFWKVRLISIVLVIASGIVTAGMLLLIVMGGTLGDAISHKAHAGGAFLLDLEHRALADRVRDRAAAVRAHLRPRPERRAARAGSGCRRARSSRALMWLALSGLFALYTSLSSSYSKTYGALAGGIVLLLWLNYTAWAILFGAELNSELDRQADIHAAGGERAGLTGRRAASANRTRRKRPCSWV